MLRIIADAQASLTLRPATKHRARCGAHLLGYFLPCEGSNVEAWGLIAFASLADYEAYRARLRADEEGQANFAFAQDEAAITSWRNLACHRDGQREGRDAVFADYSIRVMSGGPAQRTCAAGRAAGPAEAAEIVASCTGDALEIHRLARGAELTERKVRYRTVG